MILFKTLPGGSATLDKLASGSTPATRVAAELSDVTRGSSPGTLRQIISFLTKAVRRKSGAGPDGNEKPPVTSLTQNDKVLLKHIGDRITVAVAHVSNHGTIKHPVRFTDFSQARNALETLVGAQTCLQLSVAAKKGVDSENVRNLLQSYVEKGHIKVTVHAADHADLYKIHFLNEKPL